MRRLKRRGVLNAALKALTISLTYISQVVGTLMPSPGSNVVNFQPLSWSHTPAYADTSAVAEVLVGVLARLCSHLGEMTGLTIRATVSQLDCATAFRLLHIIRASLHTLGFCRPVPRQRPRAAVPLGTRRRRVNAYATTTASQPPAVTDGIHHFRCVLRL
jgi:hypothetical protein